MLIKRLFVVGVLAFVLGLLACRAASAQNRGREGGDPQGKSAPAREGERRPTQPPPGDFDQPGPGQPGEFGPPRPGHKPPLGLPRGDDSRRPGPPDQHGLMPRPQMPGGLPGGPMGPPRWPHQDWGLLQKNDPEMFKLFKEEMDLERQSRDLAGQHRQSTGSKRDDIKKQLQKAVSQQFDVRQQRRQLELKRLEEELQRLRDAIERRNKTREQIVEKRVSELLGQEEDAAF